MALHVPKAPGFAQMLKEGAKVRNGGRGSGVGESANGCGDRSEGEGPTNGPGVLPRKKRRFQKEWWCREGSAAEARGRFCPSPTLGTVEVSEAAG